MLGIAGVEGNGQTELVELIMGMRPADVRRVLLGDNDITDWTTAARRDAGIGYIPEDRHRHGLLLDFPLWENRILGHQDRPPSVRGPWINKAGARKDSERIVDAVRRPDAVDRHAPPGPCPAVTSRSSSSAAR